MNSSKKPFLGKYLTKDAVLVAFCGFFAATFLLGGASRHDVMSLLFLRPLAACMVVYAIFAMRPGALNEVRAVWWWLMAAALLVALQLVPLPPEVWASLPGRAPYEDLLAATGANDVWRPATLSVSKSYNALSSLIVPIAALYLFVLLDKDQLAWVPRLILIAAIASALLSLLQIASTPGGPLYLYRITNESDGVGLFANRNHNAVFMAGVIPIAAAIAALNLWKAGPKRKKPPEHEAILSYAAFIPILLLLLLAIISSGSRAGLLVSGPMIGFAALIFGFHAGSERRKTMRSGKKPGRWDKVRNLFWITPLIFAGIGAGLAIVTGRAGAIDRLFSGQASDLRYNVLPTLWTMIGEFFPIGSGFGSFTHVYQRFEPEELLAPQYLNQAHNDWAQILIEGGIPAAILVSVAMIAIAGLLVFFLFGKIQSTTDRLMGLSMINFIGCVAVASLVDYPSRTPSVMLTLALAFCMSISVWRRAREKAGTSG